MGGAAGLVLLHAALVLGVFLIVYRTCRLTSIDPTLFHYYRGGMDLAQARFAAGIMEARGSYYELYNNLGSVLYQRRRLKEALDCHRVVLRDDPGNSFAAERLAAIVRIGGSH